MWNSETNEFEKLADEEEPAQDQDEDDDAE